MFFYLAFGILAGLSALDIIFIIVRKFPQLAIVDAESVPKAREAKKKKAIINERVERITGEWGKRLRAAAVPIFGAVREAFRRLYRRTLALEQQLQRLRPLPTQDVRNKVTVLVGEADALAAAGKSELAEQKYIEALGLDPRSVRSYRGLADVYLADRQMEQARETLEFLVKLAGRRGEETARDFANLGLACASLGDHAAARTALEQAAAREPSNPKYLDLLLEECILGGDKSRAIQVFAQLQEVNPDNQKLPEFEAAINAMAVAEPAAAGKKAKKTGAVQE